MAAETEARKVSREVIEARWVTATFDDVIHFSDTHDWACRPSRRMRRLENAIAELAVLAAGGLDVEEADLERLQDQHVETIHVRIVEWAEVHA